MLDWRTTSVVSLLAGEPGVITAKAAVATSLDRIAACEGDIRAWQHLDAGGVAEQADRCDSAARGPDRPLHGVPVAVKDIFDTIDMPTSYGSAIHAGHRPSADASCVALARAAGAIVLGKTVTTEFAGIAPGKTRNPHRLTHTPGGSSSGSAAAVAAGMVPLALGSQTAGSTIRPAAFCGVVGFKPSFGLIERAGVKPLASSLDTVGLFAGSVPDIALFAAVLAERRELAAIGRPTAPRIGIFTTAQQARLDPAARDALQQVARIAPLGGAPVAWLAEWASELPLLEAHATIMAWEVPQALAYERLFRPAELQSKSIEMLARPVPSAERLAAARALVREARDRLDELFAGCDVIVAPPALGPAPQGLDSTGDAAMNSVWTALGVPAVCIPVLRDADDLPVGVQVIARPGDDAGALAIAAWLEQGLRSSAAAG